MRRFFPAIASLGAALGASLGAALLTSCSLTLWNYSNIAPKHYALVYGVAMYESTASVGVPPNLNFPGSDAQSVAAMLTAEGYLVKSRWVDAAGNEWVDGVEGPNIATNMTNAPTRANLIADLAALGSQVGSNDLFVFYFSGHGMQVTGTPPVEYIVPEGGVSGGYGIPGNSVSDTELVSFLGPISTNRKVVILDSCNSGGFIGSSLEADSIPAASLGNSGGISVQALAQALDNYLSFSASSGGLSPYGGAMVLSAAGRDESCYEDAPGGPFLHGIVTYYLLQAPWSADFNHDGHVTVGEAFSLVKAAIDQDWNGNAGVQAAGETFEPRISGGPIDFVLW